MWPGGGRWGEMVPGGDWEGRAGVGGARWCRWGGEAALEGEVRSS